MGKINSDLVKTGNRCQTGYKLSPWVLLVESDLTLLFVLSRDETILYCIYNGFHMEKHLFLFLLFYEAF